MPDSMIPAPDVDTDDEGETVASLTVTGLTASRPVSTDGTKTLVSGADWTYAAGSDGVISIKVTGDTNARFSVTAAGSMSWGPGNAAADVTLARASAGVMELREAGTQQKLRAYSVGGEYIEISADNASSTAYVRASAGGFLSFGIGSTNYWGFWTTGHWNAETDNAYDLGATGSSRVRSVYIGTHLQVEGSSSGASIRVPTATAMRVGTAGSTYYMDLGDVTFRDGDGSSSGASITLYGYLAFEADTILVRDAAHVLAQKNLANAQTFRIYGTTTGPRYFSLRHDGTNAILDQALGAGDINVQFGAATYFQFVNAGSFRAGTDNGQDCGSSGQRWRSIYVGTSVINAVGSAGSPSYTFTGALTSGMFGDSGDVGISRGGVAMFYVTASGVVIEQTTGNFGALLVADAANVLALKNSTTAQAHRIYGTTTGPKYLELSHDGTDAYCITNSGRLGLGSTALVPWLIQTTGHLFPNGDNSYDIGSAAASLRSIYFDTQAIGASGSAGAPVYSIRDGTYGFWSNSSATVDLSIAGTRKHGWSTDAYFIFDNAASIQLGASQDLILRRTGAGTMSQSNGANPQTWHLYNNTDSDTSPANYERLNIFWTGNEATIRTEAGGTGVGRVLRLTTQVTAGIQFAPAGSNRILITGTGHLTWNTDNTLDIGASGATRPRTLYVGTSIVNGVGSASAPSYTFAGDTSTGFFNVTNSVQCVALNSFDFFPSAARGYVAGFSYDYTGTTGGCIYLGDNTDDVILGRIAANVLGLVRGTNAQTFRVYGTTTGPKYLSLSHDGTDGYINAFSGNLYFYTANAFRWGISASCFGPLSSDNTYDIGQAGNTVRSGYFGTSVSIGTNPADSGLIRLQNDTTIRWRNAANSANIDALAVLSTDNVVLGNGAYAIRIGNNASATIGFHGATPVAPPTYGAPTGGGPTRTTFDTTTVTLPQLAERVRAIIDDFRSRGDFA